MKLRERSQRIIQIGRVEEFDEIIGGLVAHE
jgi:hypothetical protein